MPPLTPSHCNNTHHWRAWLLCVALVCVFNQAWAQQSAARVMAVTGYAKIMDTQGNERNVEKGTELFAGDKVLTSDGALVQLRLNDGGFMSVRPGTELVIDQFVHDEKVPSNSSFLVTLLRGGFRSITGLIGRNNPKGYQIRSATATIGIRGTDHEPVVVLDTPGMHSQDAPGLYDKVNDGETFIISKGGVLPLKRGEIGFAPFSSDKAPQVLLKVPDFYKVEVKTDARDAKDSADKGKNTNTTNGLLRPSLTARRNAQQATDAAAAAAGAANGQTSGSPATADGTAATATTNGTAAKTSTTADQRRAAAAAALQALTTNSQKTDSTAPAATTQATTPLTFPIAPRTTPQTTPPPPPSPR